MRTLALAIAATFVCAFPAHADTTFRGLGGTGFDWAAEHNDVTFETRNGYFAGGAVETDVGRLGPFSIALGGEVSYLRSPIDNAEVDSDLSTLGFYGTGRAFLDIGNLHPYVSGGLGLAVNSYQVEGRDRFSEADPGLGWFTGVGVDFDVTRHIGIGAEYRYMGQDLVSPGDKFLNDHFQGPRQHLAVGSVYFRF